MLEANEGCSAERTAMDTCSKPGKNALRSW